MSGTAGAVISAIGGVAALGSVFVYLHKRQKIPRLSFDGYFKTDQPVITGNIQTKVTTFCVRIIDINPKSEGEVRQCAGTLSIGTEDFRTIWMFEKKRHHNFVKQARLKLFDVDTRDGTLGLFNATDESNARRSPASAGRRMGDNITMQLDAARGHCPAPVIENIEHVINNSEYF